MNILYLIFMDMIVIKRHLSKYLYDNLGLNIKKSYLILKESYEKEEYFICEEPYEKDELNPNKELKKQIT